MNDIIRRKLARAAMTGGGEGGPGADQGWRLAFARAARDGSGLMVEVPSMRQVRRSLAELLELPPERSLLALLDGPQGGLGLLVLSAEVMSAVIEMQTTGRVAATPPLPRRPTRTDATMVAGVIDRALEELEAVLAEEADLEWAGGFRYASFLEDPRPLGLLLEDVPFRVLSAEVVMSGGVRKGTVLLALPAEGRGLRPAGRGTSAGTAPEAPVQSGFSVDLGAAVMAADCTLQAVIARVTLPLRDIMALTGDQILPLGQAALDQISLEGIDGRPLAQARLGQHRGMRAVRLKDGAALDPMASRGTPAEGALGGGLPVGALSPAADPGLPGLPMALDAGADVFAGFPANPDLEGGLLATG